MSASSCGSPATADENWSWRGHGVAEVSPGEFHGVVVPSAMFAGWRAGQGVGASAVLPQTRQTRALKAGMRVFLVPTMSGGLHAHDRWRGQFRARCEIGFGLFRLAPHIVPDRAQDNCCDLDCT